MYFILRRNASLNLVLRGISTPSCSRLYFCFVCDHYMLLILPADFLQLVYTSRMLLDVQYWNDISGDYHPAWVILWMDSNIEWSERGKGNRNGRKDRMYRETERGECKVSLGGGYKMLILPPHWAPRKHRLVPKTHLLAGHKCWKEGR